MTCEAAGVDVVRRRSGGGVVLLVPGECLWLDVVVPRDDPRWDDDVARAMWWLGEVWCQALAAVDVADATRQCGFQPRDATLHACRAPRRGSGICCSAPAP